MNEAASLHTESGRAVKIAGGPKLQRMAMKWSYVARHRKRWKGSAESIESLRSQITEELAKIGIKESDLQRLGDAQVVEVSIPFSKEEEGWAARIMPWELLISVATRPYSGAMPLLVIRHLRRKRSPSRSQHRHSPRTASFLTIAPGPLSKKFTFKSEQRFLENALPGFFHETGLLSPSFSDFKEFGKKSQDILHISGVDNHQASQILKLAREERLSDGLPFRSDKSDDPDFVAADEVAKAIAQQKPQLVGFNTHNSAARLAPLTVGYGARAAIGFQDTFDDNEAELFYVDFYQTWLDNDWDLLATFHQVWRRLYERGKLVGTGIVLWSDRPLLKQKSKPRKSPGPRVTADPDPTDNGAPLLPNKQALLNHLNFRIECIPKLNYSMLHNNRNLFGAFEIQKFDLNQPVDLDIEVILHVGASSFPYRAHHRMEAHERKLLLDDIIRVPLTPSLLQSVGEQTWTTLYVAITCGEHVLERETRRVALLPSDEWVDTQSDGKWLPSFVLPRDPAVERIIDQAQRYLYALSDYSEAGFDGYQSVVEEDARSVDDQVKAIWWAIIQELQLGYINPPPTYTKESQRLRTPSQISKAGRGTCIDLSLLVASCLEYVGIYSVIFLLKGHACPGYWRTERAYKEEFLAFRSVTGQSANDFDHSTTGEASSNAHEAGYILAGDAFSEVRQHIRSDSLHPLESVNLTRRLGFEQSLEDGRDNLRRKADFDMMIDVMNARKNAGITPLPLNSRPYE